MTKLGRVSQIVLAGVLSGILLAVIAFPSFAGVGLLARTGATAWEDLPSDLKIQPAPQRTYAYANDGKTLLAIFYNENRMDVSLASMSSNIKNAMVASEDSSFYDHPGYDLKGIIRAFVTNSRGDQTSGASTITMQYVRQALTYYSTDPEQIILATEDTPQRKLRELKYAVELEQKLSKDEILERYLNIAYFGHGAYGIQAASQVYFNKTANKLSLGEASLLAGLVKSPSAYDPALKSKRQAALDRRQYVLAQMVINKYITQAQANAAAKEPLKFYGKATPAGCVATYANMGEGFFCDYLERWWTEQAAFGKNSFERKALLYTGGFKIVTSLEVTTQRAAVKYASGKGQAPAGVSPKSRDANLIAAVEPGTGRVLALGSNRTFSNDQSKNGPNTNPARRGQKGNYPNTTVPILTGTQGMAGYQAGSVFKIFTVVAALERGVSRNFVINAPSVFQSKYVVSSGTCAPRYCAKNANPSWMDGPRNMYTGFGRSVNTFFVPLQQKIGAQYPVDAAKRMGISFSAKGTKSHPSDFEFAHDPNRAKFWGPFTLGVSSVTPLEMANAYATIAADGKYCKPTPIKDLFDRTGKKLKAGQPQCKQVIKKEVAKYAVDVARCPVGDKAKYGKCDGGTAEYTRGVVGRPVAGKSGTTDAERTATFSAFTKNMSVFGMLVDTDNPLNHGRLMKHPPVNYAVVYTLRDGLKGKPVIPFS